MRYWEIDNNLGLQDFNYYWWTVHYHCFHVIEILVSTSNFNTGYQRRQLTVVTVTGEDRKNGDASQVIDAHRCIPNEYDYIGLQEISRLALCKAWRDIKTTPIQGFKRYQHYPYTGLQEISGLPYTGLQEISRLPLYSAWRDIKTTPIHGFKRYQDYPYTGLQEISKLALCRAWRDIKTTPIQGFKRYED